jgi:hypothetical protein
MYIVDRDFQHATPDQQTEWFSEAAAVAAARALANRLDEPLWVTSTLLPGGSSPIGLRVDPAGPAPRSGTAAHARWEGEQLGLGGEALELFVAGGAAARHAARVEEATRALTEAACEIGRIVSYVEHERRDTIAIVLALLDESGIGGRRGATGDATARIPALARLGKGRKQASDGSAWDSAIRAARSNLQGSLAGEKDGIITIRPCPLETAQLRVEVASAYEIVRRYMTDDENETPTPVVPSPEVYDVTLPEAYTPWLDALARRALLHLGGDPTPLPDRLVVVRDDAVAWASLLA